MKPRNLLMVCFAIFLNLPLDLQSQSQKISFERISSSKGLSQSFVHCLLKDTQGFIWAGTQDGLNQFDGYRFTNFYSDPENSTSLSDHYIWDLLQSKDSTLWIGTNRGDLCKYQATSNNFECYSIETGTDQGNQTIAIRSLFETKSGNILLGTSSGLYFFDKKTEYIRSIEERFNQPFFSFLRISEQHILIGSLEKIFLFDESDYTLKECPLNLPIKGGIHAIVQSKFKDIWIGSGNGLFKANFVKQSKQIKILEQYLPDSTQVNAISSVYISALKIDDSHNLWIASNKGLNQFDLQHPENGFSHYLNNSKDDRSLSSDLIFDIIEVEKNTFWLATQSGINQFSIDHSAINSLVLEGFSNNNCGQSIHGMAFSQNGDVLACTEKGLLQVSKIGLPDSKINCFDKKYFPEMVDEFLVNIKKGKQNNYWVAMRRGGFAAFQNNGSKPSWKPYKLPAGNYSNIGTNDFLEDDNEILWIASSGLGLWRYDLKSESYTSFKHSKEDDTSLSGNYIFSLMEDHLQQLWVATADGGLCKMDKATATFTSYTHHPSEPYSISNNMVLSVFEDSRNNIWVGTVNGLNLLMEDGKFKRFYKKDGLPNNVIYGILEDKKNQLWISTDQGLSRLLIKDNKYSFKNYTTEDGLLYQEFNQHAFIKASNDQLFFGNKGGIIFFDPLNLKPYQIPPRSVFTDFKLFNESVSINDGATSKKFCLKKHINHTTKITLSHKQNFIAFEFSGINFKQAKNNQYAYQMKGLDEDWVYSGSRRYASYPNLKPGTYTFLLKSANHNNIWEQSPRQIRVIIKTPPWKTWWAYLIYLISLGLLILGFFQIRVHNIRQIEKTKNEERLRFRKRSARDFHDEAGNQITKISLMTELAKRKTEQHSDLNEIMTDIENHIQDLRSNMRDFIWVIDPDNDNLYETLIRLKSFANDIFEYSLIHFSTSGINESLKPLVLDGNKRRHLLLIFKEAINNCLKYSKAENAQLITEIKDHFLNISLTDDGKGFDPNHLKRGQGLKNIQTRAKKIGSLCTINSVPNKGTTIRIKIKITQMGD